MRESERADWVAYLLFVSETNVGRDGVLVVSLSLQLDNLVKRHLGQVKLLVAFGNLHVEVNQTLPNHDET